MMNTPLFDATSRGVLLMLAGLIALTRLHTLGEPQGVDVSVYSLAGQALLEGQSLYSGVWDHKPPAIYLAFALALGFFSDFDIAIYVLGTVLAMAALPGVYAAASLWGKERIAGLWASAFWAVASRDILLQADQPNGESFMNVFMVWSLALFLKPKGNGARWSFAVTQGLLFFMASWFKPFSILHAGLLALVYIVWCSNDEGQRKTSIQEVLVMVLTGAVLWGATFLWFIVTGNFNEFYEAVFVFNSSYPGNMFLNVLWGLEPGHLLHQSMFRVLPLFLVAALGIALEAWRPMSKTAGLFSAYAVAVVIMVGLPGGYYPHYYQLWLPLLAVVSGRAVGRLGNSASLNISAHRLGGAVLAVLLLLQLPYYRLSAMDVAKMKYGKVVESRQMAVEWIGQALLPKEQFYVWGFDPAVYWYSLRPPPTRFVGNTSLFQGPMMERHFKELLFNFSNQPPELLVVSPVSPRNHPNWKWFEDRYSELRLPFIPNYRFFYLKGGALEARLQSGAQ